MTELRLTEVDVREGGKRLASAEAFSLESGELVALIGPNGAGKTTLLRAALGLAAISQGEVQLDGQAITALTPATRARKIAYLPQARPLAWPNLVRDVVALGRFAHGAALGRLSPEDAAAVDRALTDCDLTHLADRRADTLSGGELARVHCARAFAAETPLLIADEPTAALDPRQQHRVMGLIRRYVGRGSGALAVVHDISLAARYADRLVWMKDGAVVADGAPSETLTEARMRDVFGVEARITGHSVEIIGPA